MMTQTISIQERCANKAQDAFGEIEYQIDEYMSRPFGSDWECIRYLNKLGYSPMVIKYMSGQLSELMVEVKNKEGCEQLEEAYDFFTKTDKKKFIAFLDSIESDIATYLANNKTKRRAKLKTPAQIVSKLPYLKRDGELVSIDPEEIIRARSLFTYNIKTRRFACYTGHLSVKKSSITGFDDSEEKTLTDRSLLDRIVQGGNIIASGFMDELKTKSYEPSKIITKNTILLKVIK